MKIFTKNTQFYEYLGMGMGIDTQFLGFLGIGYGYWYPISWVLGIGYGLGIWVIWDLGIGYGLGRYIHTHTQNTNFFGLKALPQNGFKDSDLIRYYRYTTKRSWFHLFTFKPHKFNLGRNQKTISSRTLSEPNNSIERIYDEEYRKMLTLNADSLLMIFQYWIHLEIYSL